MPDNNDAFLEFLAELLAETIIDEANKTKQAA